MIDWYKGKMDFHHKQWEISQDLGKEKAAESHMQQYLDYKEMHDRMS